MLFRSRPLSRIARAPCPSESRTAFPTAPATRPERARGAEERVRRSGGITEGLVAETGKWECRWRWRRRLLEECWRAKWAGTRGGWSTRTCRGGAPSAEDRGTYVAVSVETNVRAKSSTQPLLVAKAPLRQSRIEDQDASLTDRKSVLSDQIPPDLLPARTISFPPQTVSKQAYLKIGRAHV